jgi:DNA-binding MarR family transcriptional regulator
MAGLPLFALLSQPLVAFIIEFDNEFEHQTPHHTTNFGTTPGFRHPPFLVSMVMWQRLLRFIPDEGVPARDLLRLTGFPVANLRRWLVRMSKWWGYVTVDANRMVRPTPGGRRAFANWRPLTGIIEARWQERFGKDSVEQPRQSLGGLVDRFETAMPDSLPILGYGLVSADPSVPGDSSANRTLPALLSKVLLRFAIDFEQESELSLAICANVVRLMGEDGVAVRELPRQASVSREAIAMSVSFLEKRGYAKVASEPASRMKVLKLTAKGREAKEQYQRLVPVIEERWQEVYGQDTVQNVRASLVRLMGEAIGRQSPLFRGLEPYPDNWRAAIPRPEGLPHYPMILHRGGFPDGS